MACLHRRAILLARIRNMEITHGIMIDNVQNYRTALTKNTLKKMMRLAERRRRENVIYSKVVKGGNIDYGNK